MGEGSNIEGESCQLRFGSTHKTEKNASSSEKCLAASVKVPGERKQS